MNDNVFKEILDLGFTLTKPFDPDMELVSFTRKKDGDVQTLTIENHEDDKDIRDWLIYSGMNDGSKDWWGGDVDMQYPLTLKETRIIVGLIENLKRVYYSDKYEKANTPVVGGQTSGNTNTNEKREKEIGNEIQNGAVLSEDQKKGNGNNQGSRR